jgi:hypothetical protein
MWVMLICRIAKLLQDGNHLPIKKLATNQGVNQVFKISEVFWNSNGFKDLKKHRFISDLTKEYNHNFIAISETGRSDFTPRFLKNLCSGEIIYGIVNL